MASDMTTEVADDGDGRAYHGFCDEEGKRHVVVVEGAAIGRPLALRLDLANKSPNGFAWGYGGSGPAQLALALCADATGDDEGALSVFQRFKSCVISQFPQDAPWSLSASEVRRHCRDLMAERAAGQDGGS